MCHCEVSWVSYQKCFFLYNYWVGQKVHLFFSVRWHLAVFNFIQSNFVRLYCDSCHISMHLRKTSTLVNFLYSHWYWRWKKICNIFSILCFIISRKVKMQLKCKKRVVWCMEKMLWLIECVKSGLWSFVLEISHRTWSMFG